MSFFKGENHIASAYSKKERPLLCLTTLHHRRYVEDIINSIGLPAGSHIRLRYRKQYVCSSLWDTVLGGRLGSRQKALIALIGTNENGDSEVAPIRKGRIFKASCKGELLVLDIILGDYVFSDNSGKDVLASFQANTTNFPSIVGPSKSSPGTYVQYSTASMPDLKSNSSVVGWERISKAYFQIDFAVNGAGPNAPFLFNIGKLGWRTRWKLTRTGKLNINMGHQLQLEINIIARASSDAIKNALGEVVLDICHPAADFISSRRVRADSSRDIKSIGIITTPLFRAADGHLSIRTCIFKPKDPIAPSTPAPVIQGGVQPAQPAQPLSGNQDMLSSEKRSEIIVARYDFPLRVGGYRPWIASGFIAGAAALSVYKVSAQGKASDFTIPILIFFMTFIGLGFGIVKK